MNPDIFMKCVAQEKVDETEFRKMAGGKIENPSENLKCFSKCFLEQHGLLSAGKLNEQKIMAFLNGLPAEKKDMYIAAFNKCKTKTGASECDTAYQYMVCMEENVPK